MSDVILVVILVAAFLLAIALVHALDRLISKGATVDDVEAEPPDTGPDASAASAAADQGRSR